MSIFSDNGQGVTDFGYGFRPHRIAPHVPPSGKKTSASYWLSDKQIAMATGRLHYQGPKCKYGHAGIRQRSNGRCVDCKLASDRARVALKKQSRS